MRKKVESKDSHDDDHAKEIMLSVPDGIETEALNSEYLPGLTEPSLKFVEGDLTAGTKSKAVPEEGEIEKHDFSIDDPEEPVPEEEPQLLETDSENPIVRITTSIDGRTGLNNKSGWITRTLTWRELCDRLAKPFVTKETYAEFSGFNKAQKAEKKDHGGFIGGCFFDPKEGRKKKNVAARCLWTADIDKCSPECFTAIQEKQFFDFKCSIDTSHSHSTESPRFRITGLFSREVTSEEYELISRQLADELNEKMVDFQLETEGVENEFDLKILPEVDPETITDSARIIFWPSHSIDGTFVHKEIEGSLIDVDAVLKRREAAVKNSEVQRKLTKKNLTKKIRRDREKHSEAYTDPCLLTGVEGLFNRAYSVREVIDIFLSDVYKPTDDPDRYTFIDGSSEKGLVITGEKLAFSHHATDAANGMPLSPFWLLCVHKYGKNKKAAENALSSNIRVKALRIREKAEESNTTELRKEYPMEDDLWIKSLKLDEKGKILGSPSNCAEILENDPMFAHFAQNEMSGRIEITGSLPWEHKDDRKNRLSAGSKIRIEWSETDRASCIVLLDKLYASFNNPTFGHALRAVTRKRRINPLREWLEGLPAWDGKPRIATLLSRAFQAEDCDYTAAVMRKTLCAVIARVYHPGCEFNYVTVLDGKQGIGKSSFWRWLIGKDYFMDSLSLEDMHGKVAAEKIQGYAIAEIAELAGMRKADIEAVKAFITSNSDDYRGAYEEQSARRLRRCIFVATVNGERGYLRDPDGNRRYWPVQCFLKSARIWDKLFNENDRLQIWSEAMKFYQAGEVLDMDTPALREEAEKRQRLAIENDDRQGLVERFLDMSLPLRWDDMPLDERRDYLKRDHRSLEGTFERTKVCAIEIYREVFEGDSDRMARKTQLEIANIMQRIDGWEATGEREYVPLYGRQRIYRKKPFKPVPDETDKSERARLREYESFNDETISAEPEATSVPALLAEALSVNAEKTHSKAFERFAADTIPVETLEEKIAGTIIVNGFEVERSKQPEEKQPEEKKPERKKLEEINPLFKKGKNGLDYFETQLLDTIKAYYSFIADHGSPAKASEIVKKFGADEIESVDPYYRYELRKALFEAAEAIDKAKFNDMLFTLDILHSKDRLYFEELGEENIPF